MNVVGKDQEGLNALKGIEEVYQQQAAITPQGITVDIGSVAGQVCGRYSEVKPLILTALKLVERIPVYGKQIGMALRLLMGLLDTVCQVA